MRNAATRCCRLMAPPRGRPGSAAAAGGGRAGGDAGGAGGAGRPGAVQPGAAGLEEPHWRRQRRRHAVSGARRAAENAAGALRAGVGQPAARRKAGNACAQRRGMRARARGSKRNFRLQRWRCAELGPGGVGCGVVPMMSVCHRSIYCTSSTAVFNAAAAERKKRRSNYTALKYASS